MSPSLWQGIAIKEINTLFNNADGIRTVILVGSIVDDPTLVDQWSDIDLKIIIDPLILDKYYFETSWLNKLGNVFSVECNSSEHFHTLRICLDDFRRFDITFITTESLIKIENIPIYGNFKVLKNTIFDLDKIIKKIPSNGYKKMSGKELDSFQNAFWHKAIIAITKVMRNDFLIAFHLTLDLARDCLILKMNQRDEYAGTKIHRTGGYGNEFIKELSIDVKGSSAKDILKSIELYCKKFDNLSVEFYGTKSKIMIMKKFIKKAYDDKDNPTK